MAHTNEILVFNCGLKYLKNSTQKFATFRNLWLVAPDLKLSENQRGGVG